MWLSDVESEVDFRRLLYPQWPPNEVSQPGGDAAHQIDGGESRRGRHSFRVGVCKFFLLWRKEIVGFKLLWSGALVQQSLRVQALMLTKVWTMN